MKYLLKSPRGVFLIEAPDWNTACKYARLSSVVDESEGIQMLGRFLNPVRYAQQLNTTGIVICEPDLLKKAIEEFMVAHVERSWMGARDAESHKEIESELEEATKTLEMITGLKFGEI